MKDRNKSFIKYFSIILFFIIFFGGIFLLEKFNQKNPSEKDAITENNQSLENRPANNLNKPFEQKTPKKASSKQNSTINMPLENALSRITKKPFGIKISPENSPIQPEKFSGYHTGADFEIKAEEKNKDIQVKTICSGELIFRKSVNGYGGVGIQKCEIQEQPVTVIYGHLDLESIENEGVFLTKEKKLGILGEGFSSETDGERKHLHLGIHKGSEINFLGYVENPKLLENWIDPVSIIK